MDRYDEAIDHLMDVPEEKFGGAVNAAWNRPRYEAGGSLFLFVTPTGQNDVGHHYGCLTQVKGEDRYMGRAWTEELTAAIRADDRIPSGPDFVRQDRAQLEVLAGWQRRLDALWPGRYEKVFP